MSNSSVFCCAVKNERCTEGQWRPGKTQTIPEFPPLHVSKCFSHHWAGRRALWLDHCQLPKGKLGRGMTQPSPVWSIAQKNKIIAALKICYCTFHRLLIFVVFAEKRVERIRTAAGSKDCRLHGSWRSINTDCLCGPGWSQGSRLPACQTVWLPLQCLHTQFPLLWQKWSWEVGSGESSAGEWLCPPFLLQVCTEKK